MIAPDGTNGQSSLCFAVPTLGADASGITLPPVIHTLKNRLLMITYEVLQSLYWKCTAAHPITLATLASFSYRAEKSGRRSKNIEAMIARVLMSWKRHYLFLKNARKCYEKLHLPIPSTATLHVASKEEDTRDSRKIDPNNSPTRRWNSEMFKENSR